MLDRCMVDRWIDRYMGGRIQDWPVYIFCMVNSYLVPIGLSETILVVNQSIHPAIHHPIDGFMD